MSKFNASVREGRGEVRNRKTTASRVPSQSYLAKVRAEKEQNQTPKLELVPEVPVDPFVDKSDTELRLLMEWRSSRIKGRRDQAYRALLVITDRQEREYGVGPYRPVALELDALLAQAEKEELEKEKNAKQKAWDEMVRVVEDNADQFLARRPYPQEVKRTVTTVTHRLLESLLNDFTVDVYDLKSRLRYLPDALGREIERELLETGKVKQGQYLAEFKAQEQAISKAMNIGGAMMGR